MRLQSRAPGGAAQPAPPSPTVFAARRQLVARLLASKSEAERDALLEHPAAPVDDELVWNLAYAARDLQQHGAPRQEVDHSLDVAEAVAGRVRTAQSRADVLYHRGLVAYYY